MQWASPYLTLNSVANALVVRWLVPCLWVFLISHIEGWSFLGLPVLNINGVECIVAFS